MATGTSTTYEWWTTGLTMTAGTLGTTHEIVETRTIRRLDGTDFNTLSEWNNLKLEGVRPYVDQIGFGGSYWQSKCRCRSVTLERVDGRHVIARYVFNSIYSDSGGGGSTVNWLPTYTEYNTRLRAVQIWRTGANAPTNVDATTEIAGTNVNNGLEPLIQEIPQLAFKLRVNIDSSAGSVLNQIAAISDDIGKLNNATFYGFGAGTVLWEGVNCIPFQGMTEMYEVTADFLYDPWFHLSQVADVDPDGRVIQADSAAATGPGAKTVKWKRIARQTIDFNAIFASADSKTLAQTGWWP